MLTPECGKFGFASCRLTHERTLTDTMTRANMTTSQASENECAHCDIGREHSLADCEECQQTCCDTCYELFHAYGPCDPDARTPQKDTT